MKKVILIGSSIFELWYNYKEAFKGFNAVNRAIGGTQTIHWQEKDLLPILQEETPDIVIMYCGSNDMFELDEETTKTNVIKSRKLIGQYNPAIKFAYFSIIKAPGKKEIWSKVERVNAYIKENLNPRDYFYDFNSIFFENNTLIDELFLEDLTHHPDKAYDKLVIDVVPKMKNWLPDKE